MVYVGLKSNTFNLRPSGRPFEKRVEAWWSPYISWGRNIYMCIYIYIIMIILWCIYPSCFSPYRTVLKTFDGHIQNIAMYEYIYNYKYIYICYIYMYIFVCSAWCTTLMINLYSSQIDELILRGTPLPRHARWSGGMKIGSRTIVASRSGGNTSTVLRR